MGAAKLVPPYSFQASGLIGTGVEGEICVCGYVRTVAISRRTLVARLITPDSCCQGGSGSCPGRCRRRCLSMPFRLPWPRRAGVTRSVPPPRRCTHCRRPSLISRRPGGTVARPPQRSSDLVTHPLKVGIERAWVRRRPAHEQPMVVAVAVRRHGADDAVSVDPIYITRLASSGAMPIAWVMSSVCSVSSQLPPALVSTQLVLVHPWKAA